MYLEVNICLAPTMWGQSDCVDRYCGNKRCGTWELQVLNFEIHKIEDNVVFCVTKWCHSLYHWPWSGVESVPSPTASCMWLPLPEGTPLSRTGKMSIIMSLK